MKTILLGWELGAGLGHVGPLLRIARELKRLGHRPVFVLRDVVGPQAVLAGEGFTLLQAPVWPKPMSVEGRPFRLASYGDLMAQAGYLDTEGLAALVAAWDNLIDLVRPDLIVADHSPTLCLAAYGVIPVALVGNGYTLPPVHMAVFPPFYPDHPPLVAEGRVLETIHAVQRRRGRRSPATLPALLDTQVRAIACWPELDPYRRTRSEPLVGPLDPMPELLSLPDEPRIFAYLGEEYPALSLLVECLAEIDADIEAYLRGDVSALRHFLAARGIRVHERPPPLPEVLQRASAVVCHGGTGVVHAAMAAGRPQLIASLHVETALTVEAVSRLGIGTYVPAGEKATVKESFEKLYTDEAMRNAAITQAHVIARRERFDGLGATVDACAHLLA
ncbi:MAG TPA: nucleotide disphospho-sugar-binding domain-containing protein [Candidatus Cybelea sp.]|nr:nucleotide disphospho-sugar-binding domain-containing protein [Candidatus Cybelea sp.]